MEIDDPVVAAAQIAFAVRLKNSSDVSDNTKNAQAIAKAWRSAVHKLNPDRFQIEAMVTPELDQKIDIVDSETNCAYEFKVSGNKSQNPSPTVIESCFVRVRLSSLFKSGKAEEGGQFRHIALQLMQPIGRCCYGPCGDRVWFKGN